jgi:membrane-anchored protein YejM (alkaline phosphatase superfamily)
MKLTNASRRLSPSLGLLVLLSVLTSGCRRNSSDNNMILITLDTQRADFIGAIRPGNAATPHIDALAERGFLFDRAYSLTPITLPSHASIFFSQNPSEIKNYNNGQVINTKRRRPSLTQSFLKNRFSTAAFLSLGVLASQFGLSEGFQTYSADFPDSRWYLTAEEINDRVFPWLEAHGEERFFLWIHYSDPHDPYAPPGFGEDFQVRLGSQTVLKASLSYYEVHQTEIILEPGINRLEFRMDNRFGYPEGQFLGRIDKLEISDAADGEEIPWEFEWGWFIRRSQGVFFFKDKAWIEIDNRAAARRVNLTLRGKPTAPVSAMRDLYRREVEYMDSQIGRLWAKLEALDLVDRTVVVMAGDHGEGLGEYINDMGDPHVGHIHYLKDVYTRVPLIFAGPGIPKGKRSSSPVSLLDLAPSILDLMGFKARPSFQGRNILIDGGEEGRDIFQETHKPEAYKNRFALLRFPWQLILIPGDQTHELYNLEEDPEQRIDLSAGREGSDILEPMLSLLEEFARDSLKNKAVIKIDKDTEEMLRTLGYIK